MMTTVAIIKKYVMYYNYAIFFLFSGDITYNTSSYAMRRCNKKMVMEEVPAPPLMMMKEVPPLK